MVKLVVLNRRGKLVAVNCESEHAARKYARLLTAKGYRVKQIVNCG
jgi:hypothetical protein